MGNGDLGHILQLQSKKGRGNAPAAFSTMCPEPGRSAGNPEKGRHRTKAALPFLTHGRSRNETHFPALWKAHQTTAARENAAPQVCARTKSRSNAHPSISRLFDSFLLLPIKTILMAAPEDGPHSRKIARSYFYSFAVQSYKSSHVAVPAHGLKISSARAQSAWMRVKTAA